MTWFGDIYAEQCVPTLMHFLGESLAGIYMTPAGESIECRGIITNIGKEVQEDETGERLRISREWIISTDPDGEYGGVADPETAATAIIDGVTYAVHDVEAITENFARLSLVRLPIKRRSRNSLRRS